MAEALRYTITFTGRVQGVGFRYTTVRVAQRFHEGAVSGWVRNEPDGSVRCVAEGERQHLERFISDIQDAMGRNILDTAIDPSRATGEFQGFEIRR